MWTKDCGFSFSISPSNEYSELISFRIDWFDPRAVQGTLKNLLHHQNILKGRAPPAKKKKEYSQQNIPIFRQEPALGHLPTLN